MNSRSPSLALGLLALAATLAPLAATLAPLSAAVVPPTRDGRDALSDALARETSTAEDAALLEDGGDPDQLTRAASRLRSRVDLTNDFAYQSNAELDGRGGEGDFVWFPSLTGNTTYRLSDRATLEGRASFQAGVYADLTELDYWGVSAEALARRELTGGWSLYGGAETYEYKSLDDGDSLSRAFAPTAGLSYARYYPGSRTYGFADVGLKHYYTDPAADERDEVAVSLGASRQLADRLYAQAYYSYRYSNYEENGRHDHRHAVGLSLIHVYNECARASIGVSFADNDSDVPGADYQTVNTTLGTGFSWEF